MTDIPEWVDKSPEEIEELIVDLRDRGHIPSQIGIILRDQYGIPSVRETLDKSMLEVLESHDMAPDIPEDLMNLMKRAVQLRNHLEQHPKDNRTKRALSQLEAEIQKLTKYYKREGRRPEDWRYDPEEAALLVQG